MMIELFFMLKNKISFLNLNLSVLKEQINFSADLIEFFDIISIFIIIIIYKDVKSLRLNEITFSKQHRFILFLTDMKRLIEVSMNTCKYVRKI